MDVMTRSRVLDLHQVVRAKIWETEWHRRQTANAYAPQRNRVLRAVVSESSVTSSALNVIYYNLGGLKGPVSRLNAM
jgi:hypothetical protein